MRIEPTKGILKSEKITEGVLVTFVITKNEVGLGATYRLEQQLQELKKAGANAKNSLILEFHGYDNDIREVYEIPEICNYLRKTFFKCPQLFYFLNIDAYTFAIVTNAVFRTHDEVSKADKSMKAFADAVGDTGRVITIDYYTKHQREFH
jgi:hypothetical protein